MSAARYLGVNPWDLADQDVQWIMRAQAAARAEGHAQDRAMKNAGK